MTVRHLGSAAFADSRPRQRVACESCGWFTYTPGSLAGHMRAAHPGLSPALVRFREAAEQGIGLSTEAAKARKGLS